MDNLQAFALGRSRHNEWLAHIVTPFGDVKCVTRAS